MSLIFNPTSLYMQPNNQAVDVSKDVEFSFIFQGYELNSARLNLYRQNTSGKWVTINNDWYDFTLDGTKYNGDVVSSSFNLTNMLDYYGSNLGWRLEVYGYELTCNQDTQSPDDNSFPYNASGIETGDAFSFNIDGVRTLYYINIFSGNRMRFYTNREASLQSSNLNVVPYTKISGKIGKAYGVSSLVPLVLIIPPLLKLNVPNPVTIPNYEFNPTWQYFGATQSIVIKHWIATLYDVNGKQIDTSGDTYNGNLKYIFQTALISDNNYKVEYEVYDNNGYYYTTGLVDVKVFYETATSNFVPTLTTDCYDTSMSVDWSGAHNVRGVLSSGEPEYIDDYIVDGNYGLKLPKNISLTYDVDMPQNQMPTFVWEPGSVNYDGEIVRFTSDTQELIVSYNNATKTLYYTLNIIGTSYSYRSNIDNDFALKDKGTYLIGFYGNNGYIREVQTNQYVWFNVEGFVLQPTLTKQRTPEQLIVEGNVGEVKPTQYQAYATPEKPLSLVSNVNLNTNQNYGGFPNRDTNLNLFTPWISKYPKGTIGANVNIPCPNASYRWNAKDGIELSCSIDASAEYFIARQRFFTPIPANKDIHVHFHCAQPFSFVICFTNDESDLEQLYFTNEYDGNDYDGVFTNSKGYKYLTLDFAPQNLLNSLDVSEVYVGLSAWQENTPYAMTFQDRTVTLADIGTTNIKVLGQANISTSKLTFNDFISGAKVNDNNTCKITSTEIIESLVHTFSANTPMNPYPIMSNMFENDFYETAGLYATASIAPFVLKKTGNEIGSYFTYLTLEFPKTFTTLDEIKDYVVSSYNNLQIIYPRKPQDVGYVRTTSNKNAKEIGETFKPNAYPSLFSVDTLAFPQANLNVVNSGRNNFDVTQHQGIDTSWDVAEQAYSHVGSSVVTMEDMWNLYKAIDKPLNLSFDAKMDVDGDILISSDGYNDKQFKETNTIRVGQNYQRFNVKFNGLQQRSDEGLDNGSNLLFTNKDNIENARMNTPNGEDNLFDYTKFKTQTLNGVTITNLNNGAFKIDGTPTTTNVAFPYWNISHDEFVKMFKRGMLILKGEATNPSLFVQIFKSDSLIAQVVLRDGMIDTNDSIVISDAWLSDASVTARMLFSYANTSSFKGGFTRPILYQPNSQKPSITKNLFDKNDVIKGIRADANGLVDATNAQTSNYIEVTPNTQYYITNVIGLSTWYTGAYYDKNKKFISQLNISGRFPTSGTITTPSDCYYIVLNILVNNNLVDVNQVMMSLGSAPIDYEPFETIEVVDYEIVEDDMTYPQMALNIDGDYEQVITQGYQLFDASKLPTKSQGGATVTNNGDGSFTISGNGNLTESFIVVYQYSHEETLKLLKVGKIRLNQNGDDTTPYALVQLVKTGGTGVWFALNNTITEATITQAMINDERCALQIYIYGYNGSTIKSGTIKPMLWQEKNLFDYTKIPYKAVGDTSGGNSVTLFNNQDGSFTIAGKNLFNVNGNVNVKGNNGVQVNRNTVQDGVLTSLINSATDHAVGQRLYGLKGKTISFNAKLKSIGNGTAGGLYIYDGGTLKKQAAMTSLNIVFAINNYTCETDDVVVAFGTGGGTGAQFYDIMVSYGAASAGYVAFDTPVTLAEVFSSDAIRWNTVASKQKLKAGTIILDALATSKPYFEFSGSKSGSYVVLMNNANDAMVSGEIEQEWINDDTTFSFIFYRAANQPSTPTIVYPIVYQPYDGTWEPFTGGEPSPNPSYPQEPDFIGDIGQNLFDFKESSVSSKSGNLVTSWSGNSLTYYMDSGANGYIDFNVNIPKGTYYMNKAFSQATYFYNGDTAVATTNDGGKVNLALNVNRIRLNFNHTTTPITISDLMVSSKYYQYRPYSDTPKYYLDINAQFDNLLNGDYFVEQAKLSLINLGVSTNNTSLFINRQTYRGRDCLFINANNTNLRNVKFLENRFKPNTRYYINLSMISYDASLLGKTGLYLVVDYRDGSYTLLAVPNEKDEFGNIFFASDPNKTISLIRFTYAYHPKAYIDLDNSFICEEAIYNKSIINSMSIDLDQPLRALPNGVSDYVTQDGNVIRNVGEITYNGSEAWNKNSSSDPSNWMYYVPISKTRAKGLCNLLAYKTIDIINQGAKLDNVGFNLDHNVSVMYLNVGYYMEQAGLTNTVANLKTWLQSNPITVWYELATPTTTPLTDEQKQQWNSLQRFNKKTHIYGNFKTAMIEYNQGLKSGALSKVSVRNISMSTDTDILYEPYSAQTIDVSGVQPKKLYNNDELISSGIVDNIDFEKALFTQYIKFGTFSNPTSIVSGVGVNYVTIPKPNDYSGYGNITQGAVMGDSFRSSASKTLDDYEEFILYTRYNSNLFYLSIPKGMEIDLIKNNLLNKTFYYTLSNPITTNILSKLGQQWDNFRLNEGLNTIYGNSDNGVYPYMYLTYRDATQTS